MRKTNTHLAILPVASTPYPLLRVDNEEMAKKNEKKNQCWVAGTNQQGTEAYRDDQGLFREGQGVLVGVLREENTGNRSGWLRAPSCFRLSGRARRAGLWSGRQSDLGWNLRPKEGEREGGNAGRGQKGRHRVKDWWREGRDTSEREKLERTMV